MPKVFIETYGCQMNVADSEVVVAILMRNNYELTEKPEDADLILVNTCSIRDNAEKKVKNRLTTLASIKTEKSVLGIIGCMAERMKEELIEELPVVDIIAGPDSYRDLPGLIDKVSHGEKGINTLLSLEETYSEIRPVRMDKNGVSAFISIMRGCDNFCTYCVVPYTRGRERSREPETIMEELLTLAHNKYKEVTFLGQNVNSYLYRSNSSEETIDFPGLMARAASKHPDVRFRFATSHPKDISESLIKTIAAYDNICKHIHLPVQSGSTRVLKKMNRKYTAEDYYKKIEMIRNSIPDVSLSTDIIAGFCGETEEDHHQTLSMMENVAYDFAYMFKYSERPGTVAEKKYPDDVPEEIKTRRLNEIIALQNELSAKSKEKDIGKTFTVLVEGSSKKSDQHLFGRTSQNKVVVFPKKSFKAGDYAVVKINSCTSATLIGE